MSEQSAADLIAKGRELAPWHLDVEISPDISTRDLAHDDFPDSFGKVRLIDPRPSFMDTLGRLYPGGLGGRTVLDCACNCGGYLFWARDAGAGDCLGVDVREHWIDQARFLAEHRVASSNGMRFEARDLYDLPELGLPASVLDDELQPDGREVVALPDRHEAQVVERLESERARGARYLAVPAGSGWLASRPAVREHLQRSYALAVREHSVGAVYSLFG